MIKLKQNNELLEKLTRLLNTNKLTLEGNIIKSKDFSIQINQNNLNSNNQQQLNLYNKIK